MPTRDRTRMSPPTASAAALPYVGTWSMDPDKSDLTGTTLTFESLSTDEWQSSRDGMTYRFRIDGKDHATGMGDTAAWDLIGDGTWQTTWKSNERRILSVETLTLGTDGTMLTIANKGTTPNGEPIDDATTFRRLAGASGLEGRWVSTNVRPGSPLIIEFIPAGEDRLTFRQPAWAVTCEARLDGQDHPCVTPRGSGWTNWPLVSVIILIAYLGSPEVAGGHADDSSASAAEAQQCAALSARNFEQVDGGPAVVTSARVIDVPTSGLEWPTYPTLSGFASPVSPPFRAIRRYCDVIGYVAPQNKFELKLPLPADWNQKLFFEACGGFCGTLDGRLCNFGLARGYASVTSNGGHDSASGFDAAWAAHAPELQNDFGWRSTHVVTLVAKAIATSYYSRPIAHAYIAGNSKGGQAVLMEAQRFPRDFDGLLPSAPVYDYTGRNMIAAAWFAQAISDGHGGSVLDEAAARTIHASVLSRCGAQAGVEEGLVTDPPSCDWQPSMIACASATHGAACLTPKQVSAVARLMAPARNSAGEILWAYPYLPGSETQWVGWNYFGAPSNGIAPRLANLLLPEQFGTYLVDATVRPRVDPLTFDFDRAPPTLARSRRVYDATSVDLRAFKQRGGKIVMWHGWADGAIAATSSIGYYRHVERFMGGRARTQDFFRLFLVPGVQHGGGGPGLPEFDALSALEQWVETGQPPEKLIASRSAGSVVERSRPVFPYPVQGRYDGVGDPTDASSFRPFVPTEQRKPSPR